jgi:hypothetical protein
MSYEEDAVPQGEVERHLKGMGYEEKPAVGKKGGVADAVKNATGKAGYEDPDETPCVSIPDPCYSWQSTNRFWDVAGSLVLFILLVYASHAINTAVDRPRDLYPESDNDAMQNDFCKSVNDPKANPFYLSQVPYTSSRFPRCEDKNPITQSRFAPNDRSPLKTPWDQVCDTGAGGTCINDDGDVQMSKVGFMCACKRGYYCSGGCTGIFRPICQGCVVTPAPTPLCEEPSVCPEFAKTKYGLNCTNSPKVKKDCPCSCDPNATKADPPDRRLQLANNPASETAFIEDVVEPAFIASRLLETKNNSAKPAIDISTMQPTGPDAFIQGRKHSCSPIPTKAEFKSHTITAIKSVPAGKDVDVGMVFMGNPGLRTHTFKAHARARSLARHHVFCHAHFAFVLFHIQACIRGSVVRFRRRLTVATCSRYSTKT